MTWAPSMSSNVAGVFNMQYYEWFTHATDPEGADGAGDGTRNRPISLAGAAWRARLRTRSSHYNINHIYQAFCMPGGVTEV